MTCSRSELPIFCDWLDVTYSPDDAPYPSVNRILLDAGYVVHSSDRSSFRYEHPNSSGVVLLGPYRRSIRVSISGTSCALLRALGVWENLLWELSTSPHRVTRLDAALDLPMDGADLVARMRERYPTGQVQLSRKSISTSVLLAVRPSDGRETGTWYAGRYTKARYTARVYDKAWEALEKRGEHLPPTARVEVTASGGDSGATLRDAALPAALFWRIASPAILQAPEDAPVWTPDKTLGWTPPPREFDPAALLRRRVESFAMLDALTMVADELGPQGRAYLLSLLEKRVKAYQVPDGTSTPADTAA